MHMAFAIATLPNPLYRYEFYHDGLRAGQYTNVIKDMHKRYGSIVSKPSSMVVIEEC